MRYLTIAIVLAAATYAQAGEPLRPFGGLGLAGHCCKCYPEVKCEPIKHHCFEVEYDEICVPGVTFYLGKLVNRCKGKGGCCGCDDFCPNPGHMKCVKRFKKVEYECGERIVCDWSLCGKGKCGGQGPAIGEVDAATPHVAPDNFVPPPPAAN